MNIKTYPEEDGLWTIVAPLKIWQGQGSFLSETGAPESIKRRIVRPEEVRPIMVGLMEAEAKA